MSGLFSAVALGLALGGEIVRRFLDRKMMDAADAKRRKEMTLAVDAQRAPWRHWAAARKWKVVDGDELSLLGVVGGFETTLWPGRAGKKLEVRGIPVLEGFTVTREDAQDGALTGAFERVRDLAEASLGEGTLVLTFDKLDPAVLDELVAAIEDALRDVQRGYRG